VGCAQVGAMLVSSPGTRTLRVIEAVHHEFIPANISEMGCVDGTEYGKLVELRILPTSPDLPHVSLRDADGGWRSGDLYEEVEPGKYIYRGRDNDWIKTARAHIIDAP
jgi:hypothetical protein